MRFWPLIVKPRRFESHEHRMKAMEQEMRQFREQIQSIQAAFSEALMVKKVLDLADADPDLGDKLDDLLGLERTLR